MAGPNRPKDPGPSNRSDGFFPEDLTTENTAATSPDGEGYKTGDQRPPQYVPPGKPETEAPPSYVEQAEPPASSPPQESSGFVMEVGTSPAESEETDDEDEEDTSTAMMIWMGLGIIGATVGLAGAAILMLGYTAVVEPDEVVEETVAVDNVGGIKVRRSLRAPAEVERTEPVDEETADVKTPE